MAFHVRDEATDKAVRQLAKLKGKTLTATIREAVEREYERVSSEIPLIERLRPSRRSLPGCASRVDCRQTKHFSTSCQAISDVFGCVGGDRNHRARR